MCLAIITGEQVEHVAALARLRFDPRATEKMAVELDRILSYVNQLRTLDTSDAPPTTHALDPQENVLRDDVHRPGLTRAEALADAPEAAAGMFRVPRVVGVE
jgi:aspartyl-tRNA(Asn)/glutamyl-tRNA(Gln) amidotransferase subunit C